MASTKNGQEMMHERLKFTLSCVEKDYFSFTRNYSYETRLCMISHFQTTRISIISHLPFTEQDFGSKIKNPIKFSQYFYFYYFPIGPPVTNYQKMIYIPCRKYWLVGNIFDIKKILNLENIF